MTPRPDERTATRRPRVRRPGRFIAYWLVLPAVLLELLVHIVPSLLGLMTSMTDLDQRYIARWFEAPFVWFENFAAVLDPEGSTGASFLLSFMLTVAFTVLVVAIAWGLGFSAALVLQSTFPGRGAIRTIFLISYAMPVYAGILIWSFMLQRDSGLINHLLVDVFSFLPEKPFWLLGENAFASAVIVAVWRLWPFAFLMSMAGMQSIPDETYEAAELDGAGSWKRTWYITLGMLKPVTAVLLLMMFLWTFNDFTTPFVLFGVTPPQPVDFVSIFIYRNSFLNWNFGLGAAMSVLVLLFLAAVAAVWFYFDRRRNSAS